MVGPSVLVSGELRKRDPLAEYLQESVWCTMCVVQCAMQCAVWLIVCSMVCRVACSVQCDVHCGMQWTQNDAQQKVRLTTQ